MLWLFGCAKPIEIRSLPVEMQERGVLAPGRIAPSVVFTAYKVYPLAISLCLSATLLSPL